MSKAEMPELSDRRGKYEMTYRNMPAIVIYYVRPEQQFRRC